jgi:hypothetical protein
VIGSLLTVAATSSIVTGFFPTAAANTKNAKQEKMLTVPV